MRIFRCTDDNTNDGLPCDCWYREVGTGQWEYRYVGTALPWARTDSRWRLISAKSLEQIADYGHDLVEVSE